MIAVAGGKGGSGKTTTTLGVADALSRRGAPVVAADADWDLPNLARLAAETRAASMTAPDSDPTLVDAIHAGGEIRLTRSAPTVLGAPKAPRDVDACPTFAALDDAVPTDAPTLLDCPAGASPDAAAPLRVADRCLLVTPLRRAALRDAAKTAAIARRLDCPPLGVVVARADSVPDGVAGLFDCPVLGRVPDAAPEPLSDPGVRSAYDGIADALVTRYGSKRWRVS
ncbi:cell division inhibitor MinD-like (chromosome partitioning ATPase) [Halorubrum aidingense JCM 13560]|uniref:Cell division inhibitor MinD-like (Chromosome partitioning ATPase) n=1 Tax=Halorubrum aidingense JCM 13560 TaxID=1230454 RepID=M0PFA9_9EURY|nr:P-loop NTPase [Halorubrum aidingense]EMA68751.1 cell division inhibitor MinD-like (chromosome partitioning ATPase) [Halorubrum aidingense JCM 13560]